jgi:hypothetical protein
LYANRFFGGHRSAVRDAQIYGGVSDYQKELEIENWMLCLEISL